MKGYYGDAHTIFTNLHPTRHKKHWHWILTSSSSRSFLKDDLHRPAAFPTTVSTDQQPFAQEEYRSRPHIHSPVILPPVKGSRDWTLRLRQPTMYEDNIHQSQIYTQAKRNEPSRTQSCPPSSSNTTQPFSLPYPYLLPRTNDPPSPSPSHSRYHISP